MILPRTSGTTGPRTVRGAAADAGTTLRVLGGAGVIRPYGPRTLVRMLALLRAWGLGPAGGFASLAVREPDAPGGGPGLRPCRNSGGLRAPKRWFDRRTPI